jgi:rubrerythrin
VLVVPGMTTSLWRNREIRSWARHGRTMGTVARTLFAETDALVLDLIPHTFFGGDPMSDKPSYFGLLNELSLAETDGYAIGNEWLAVTDNDGVRAMLESINERERHHGQMFAEHIKELGFSLEPRDDPNPPERVKRMEIASSKTMTDLEKFEALGVVAALATEGDADKDFLTKLFVDTSIDVETGELLGRYICEERESGREFRACYEKLCAEAGQVPFAAK